MVNKEEVIKSLVQVEDPEMKISVIDLGLIYDIEITGNDVKVTHSLTSIFCPVADTITRNIKEAVERVEGIGLVRVILTHTPQFSKEMMSEEARLALGL